MKKPPRGSDEKLRIKTLHNYKVLDTPAESAFDDITKLAASICGTKIALVSLVDTDRQWFKSSHGLNAKETDRDISFCGHSIQSDSVFIVEDSDSDPRFKDNPLVTGKPFVKFYAGAPLIAPNGQRIGTLCVINDKKMKLENEKIEFLEGLARNVVHLLELRIKNDELTQIKEQSIDIQKMSQTGGWELDIKTSDTTWTDAVYEIYGLPVGTPTNKIDGISYYAEHEKERLIKLVDDCVGKKIPFDDVFEFVDANGVEKWVRSIGRPETNDKGEVIKLVGTFQDVTEHKKRELELLNKSQHLDLALEGGNLGIWDWKLSDDTFKVDCRWATMLGLDPTESSFTLDKWKTLIHPDDLENCYARISAYMNGEVDHYSSTHRMRHREGHWVYILDSGKISERDENGNPTRFTGTHLDITKEKERESVFQQQRLFMDSTINTLPAVFYAKDLDGKYIMVNEEFRKLFNWTNEKILGKTDHELFPEDIAKQFRENDISIAKNNKVIESNEVAIGADGIKRTYHSFKFPYRDQEGMVYATGGISLDITEKSVLERQAFHNKRLASIGELAAGVGHEINNPLAIIKGYVASLRRSLSSGKDLTPARMKNNLNRIETATDRVAGIVKGLRTFSRADEKENAEFDVVDALTESIGMIREIYKQEGVKIVFEHRNQEESIFVMGSRGRVQQVFINLFANAKDATVGQSQRTIEVSISSTDKNFDISISDNGCGIPEEIQDDIFNPFFTTKDINKGTGIGLSLVHNVMKEHKGSVTFESSNNGTTFKLCLPTVEIKDIESTSSNSESIHPSEENCGHILLVDDEEGIREIISDLLFDNGYTVTAVENGKVALDLLMKESGKYDLVLSDMKMPVMDGPTLLKELRSQKNISQPKFVIVTGGINVNFEDERNEIGRLIDGYIFKPFEQHQVLDVLSRALNDETVEKLAA